MNIHALPDRKSHEQRPSHPGDAPLDIRHLVIDDCLHPLQANGVYQVARLLTREQIHAGDHAKIILFRFAKHDPVVESYDVPTCLLPLRGTKVLGRMVRLSPAIVNTMVAGANGRTVFHIHGARQPLLWSVSRELRRRGIPYGITIHGRYSHLFDRDGKAARQIPLLYLKTVERRVLEGARFVHAVSAFEHAIVRKIAPRARLQLIPNAAFSSALEDLPTPVQRGRRRSTFPTFGFCGRYEIEHKGLDLLLGGFAQYRQNGGKGTLALIGTGPSREKLIAMAAELGISDTVTIDGPRFAEEKMATLRGWDFFAQASRFDGVPIGAIEAALCGLPLIVTAETSLQDETVSCGAGVAIRALDASSVADALANAERLDHAAWSRMSDNAQKMARSIGDWTGIAARLRELYGAS